MKLFFFEFHNIIPFFLDFYFWRKFNYRNLGKLDKKPCAFIIHRVAIFLISCLTRFRCSFLLLRQIILFLILIITRHPKKQPRHYNTNCKRSFSMWWKKHNSKRKKKLNNVFNISQFIQKFRLNQNRRKSFWT